MVERKFQLEYLDTSYTEFEGVTQQMLIEKPITGDTQPAATEQVTVHDYAVDTLPIEPVSTQ